MKGIKRLIFLIGLGIMASVYTSIYSIWGVSYDHDAQDIIDTESMMERVARGIDFEKKEETIDDVNYIVSRYISRKTKRAELLDAFDAVGMDVIEFKGRKGKWDATVMARLEGSTFKCGHTLAMYFSFYSNGRVEEFDAKRISTCL